MMASDTWTQSYSVINLKIKEVTKMELELNTEKKMHPYISSPE
jgi:hypothetical protein